jgi:hypothetical protein
MMGKVQYYAAGAAWTVALALPAALLALSLAAFFDRYSIEVARALGAAYQADWQAFVSIRWPELAGMVIGQLLLMAILLIGGIKALTGNPETA